MWECNNDVGSSSDILLRTFDLKSAYRQIALSASGRAVSHIVAYNPSNKSAEYFQCQAFDAVRRVHSFLTHSFLTLARTIWYVGVVGCKLAWSSFFDDFLVAFRSSLARNTELTIVSLLKLMGWDFAESGFLSTIPLKPWVSHRCCQICGGTWSDHEHTVQGR